MEVRNPRDMIGSEPIYPKLGHTNTEAIRRANSERKQAELEAENMELRNENLILKNRIAQLERDLDKSSRPQIDLLV